MSANIKVRTPDKGEKKPGKDTIYIDVDDEITSIIDKVDAGKGKIVALVLPKRAAPLQSIVNMRLLKRSAEQAGKNVVLITSEAKILPLAGAAGVHVAKNLQSKPYIPPSPVPVKANAAVAAVDDIASETNEKDATLDYHRSIGELAVNEEAEEPETIHLAEDETDEGKEAPKDEKKSEKAAAPKDKRLKVPNFDKFRLRMGLGVAGLILLIIFLFFATKVLPKATINIKTSFTPVSANFDLATSDSAKAVDVDKGVIPVALKSQDQTSNQQVQATGQQNNGEKASGSVSMTAQDCSAPFSAPDVPAGAALSSNGLTYITQEKTSFAISSASSCVNYTATSSTKIAAKEAGSKYNVSSGTTFSVTGRSDVSATGSASGGTDNNVTVVSQSDVDEAKKKVTSQSSDDFSKEFLKKLEDEGLYIMSSTLKVGEPVVSATPGVGQPASTVTVNIKINYSVLTLKKEDLKKVVSEKLKKQIDASKQQILDEDVLKNVSLSVQNQTSPTQMNLSVTAEASATPNIDTEDIKKKAGGMEKGAIQKLVSDIPGVVDVDTKMSPFWVSKAPKNPSKVQVNLQQVDQKNESQ